MTIRAARGFLWKVLEDEDDTLMRVVIAASLVLNFGAGAALAAVDVPDRPVGEDRIVQSVAVMEFDDMPPPEAMEVAGPTEEASPDAAPAEAAPSREARALASEESAGDDSDAAGADEAFLSAFGGGPGSGSAGSDRVAVRRSEGGDTAEGGTRPRSGLGSGGEGRLGRADLAGEGDDVTGNLGTGGEGATVERRGAVRVQAPTVSEAEAAGGGGAVASPASVDAIGTQVRRRESQIRFCYEEHGLKVNPDLAGTLRLEFTVRDGRVRDARAVRSLSGAGASATEACVLERIRGWSFPGVDEAVTVPFTFVLSR